MQAESWRERKIQLGNLIINDLVSAICSSDNWRDTWRPLLIVQNGLLDLLISHRRTPTTEEQMINLFTPPTFFLWYKLACLSRFQIYGYRLDYIWNVFGCLSSVWFRIINISWAMRFVAFCFMFLLCAYFLMSHFFSVCKGVCLCA